MAGKYISEIKIWKHYNITVQKWYYLKQYNYSPGKTTLWNVMLYWFYWKWSMPLRIKGFMLMLNFTFCPSIFILKPKDFQLPLLKVMLLRGSVYSLCCQSNIEKLQRWWHLHWEPQNNLNKNKVNLSPLLKWANSCLNSSKQLWAFHILIVN